MSGPAPSLGAHARIAYRDLRDERREVTVPVAIHYRDGASGPVIIFSHGLGGSRVGYGFLGRFWAEHGYVVVHPTHEGSDTAIFRGAGGRIGELRAMKAAIADERNWERRPRDVSFLLDALPELERAVPALAGRLDAECVGMAGHSFGAYTALLLAGARISAGETERDFSDARIRAFIALSPPGTGSRGLTERSFELVTRPMLYVTGSLDEGMSGQPASWRTAPFARLASRDKSLLFVEGADHATFSGGTPRAPAPPDMVRLVQAATLAFWDHALRGGPPLDAATLRAQATAGFELA